MAERKIFSTRVNTQLIKSLKYLSVDLNKRINDLLEEAIQDLLKKYQFKVPPKKKS